MGYYYFLTNHFCTINLKYDAFMENQLICNKQMLCFFQRKEYSDKTMIFIDSRLSREVWCTSSKSETICWFCNQSLTQWHRWIFLTLIYQKNIYMFDIRLEKFLIVLIRVFTTSSQFLSSYILHYCLHDASHWCWNKNYFTQLIDVVA